jgi:hypothetical protein
MHRIDGDGYIESAGKRLFADEDLPTRYATQVTHQWANAVQEELAQAVECYDQTLRASGAAEATAEYKGALVNGILPRGYLFGWPGIVYYGTPPTDYVISQGTTLGSGKSYFAKDATGLGVIRAKMNNAWSKSIVNSWVLGSGNGGRAYAVSAITANKWYGFFVLGKADGTFDFGFDDPDLDGYAGENLLADSGFDWARRIAWVRANADGDGLAYTAGLGVSLYKYFNFLSPLKIYDAATPPSTPTVMALNLPLNCRGKFLMEFYGADTSDWEVNLRTAYSVGVDPISIKGKSGQYNTFTFECDGLYWDRVTANVRANIYLLGWYDDFSDVN